MHGFSNPAEPLKLLLYVNNKQYPGDLSHPGINPGSPTLQADSLLSSYERIPGMYPLLSHSFCPSAPSSLQEEEMPMKQVQD